SLNSLGALYTTLGDYASAEEQLRRAIQLEIDLAKKTGQASSTIAHSLANLAGGRQKRGDPKEALSLYRKALATTKLAHGDKGPEYARHVGALASLHAEQGELKKALELEQQVAAVLKKSKGDRPAYAASLHNLASLKDRLGDRKAALGLYNEALA